MAENIVDQINNRINFLSVFLGLIVSILILFMGAFSFGGVVTTGMGNVLNYLFMVLLIMVFFGSILSGFLGSKNFLDALFNGAFLSLVIIVFTGLVMGIFLFFIVGIESSLNSALSSMVSSSGLASFITAPKINITSSIIGNQGSNIFTWFQLILVAILLFIAGLIGGTAGFYIKVIIKQIF
jgi:hypothetical protein